MRWSRIVLTVGFVALAAMLISAAFLWRATTITTVPASEAQRQFARAVAATSGATPLVMRDDAARMTRRTTAPPTNPAPISRIVVLSYRAESDRLIRSEVPFWLFRMKASAAQMLVRDSAFDLNSLGLTPAELEREGPTVIFSSSSPDGNRVLIWTE